MFKSIRWRLSAWYTLILALTLLVLGAAFYVTTANVLFGTEDDELKSGAAHLARVYTETAIYSRREEEDLRHELEERGLDPEEPLAITTVWMYLIAPAGFEFRSAPNVDAFPHPSALKQAAGVSGGFYSTVQAGRETIRVYTLPVYDRGKPAAIVQTAKPITPALNAMRRLTLALLAGGAAGLILAIIGGSFLAGRALIPIAEAFRKQREFVADASHELRTPLAILRASAELLEQEVKNTPVEAGTRELVDNLLSEGERMNRLVGDLLTLARADSGNVDLDLAKVDLVGVAERALQKTGVLAQKKGIVVRADLPPDLTIKGDAGRLEQLLLILLDNAVKYTDPGGRITLSARRNKNRAEVAVTDTGAGIPRQALPHVFDRFYRVDKARSRDQGGTGLGLAIARWIAEAHGGTIQVQSTPGKGSTFTVAIPLSALDGKGGKR